MIFYPDFAGLKKYFALVDYFFQLVKSIIMMEMKDVIKKWNEEFPILKRYTKQGLFLKTEFLLIGLSFAKDRWGEPEYDFEMEIYPLWSKYRLHNLWPLFHIGCRKEIRVSTGFFISSKSISLKENEILLNQIYEEVRSSFGDMFSYEISIHIIINWGYKYVSRCDNILNPIEDQNLFELLFATALFYEDCNLFEETERLLRKRMKKWDTKHFEVLFRMSKEQWVEEMLKRFSNREIFMSIIEENRQNPKVKKLNEAHIIYEPIVLKELPDIPIMERIKMYLRRKLGEAWI